MPPADLTKEVASEKNQIVEFHIIIQMEILAHGTLLLDLPSESEGGNLVHFMSLPSEYKG